MPHHQPSSVTAFHSCDRDVALAVLSGNDELRPSNNPWDWLGKGVYFWEQNPGRALEYAIESSERKQFNKIPVSVPFVLGAIIELGNCLNLLETESLQTLGQAYTGLVNLMTEYNQPVPVNKGNNRALDCAVIEYIHTSNIIEQKVPYDTVRCAFPEGSEAYPGAAITSRLHVQVCVLNPECIKGYFLPRPIEKFNPYLNR